MLSLPLQLLHQLYLDLSISSSLSETIANTEAGLTEAGLGGLGAVLFDSSVFSSSTPVPRMAALYFIRITTGTLSVASFSLLRRAIADYLNNPGLAVYIAALSVAQFHLPFYGSRLLGNVFATILTNLALTCLFRSLTLNKMAAEQQETNLKKVNFFKKLSIFLLVFGCVTFRCDLFIFAGPLLLCGLLYGWLSWGATIVSGVVSSICWVGITVAVDSTMYVPAAHNNPNNPNNPYIFCVQVDPAGLA